jgi:ribosomal protein L37AE/L43A
MNERDTDDNMPHQDETLAERVHEPREDDDRAVTCPFCHSTAVELLSLFGSQLSTDQWYCRACHTPFERFRHEDETH